jgi:enoyl-CoA hydratase
MADGLTYLQLSQDGPVATILLDNPPLNLLCQPLKIELMGLLDRIAEDGSIRAVILAGAGPKAFAAGADMKEFIARVENQTARADSQRGQLLCKKLYHLPQPVIAAIHGVCFGGGLEVALACDFRVAERGARLGLPEVKRGVFPGTFGSQMLPRIVGIPRAKEIMMFGELFGAEEALRFGVVDRLVDDGRLLQETADMARTLAERPANSIRSIKRLVNEGAELELEAGLELETELFEEIFETEDVREGVAAFMEKREPHFKHR